MIESLVEVDQIASTDSLTKFICCNVTNVGILPSTGEKNIIDDKMFIIVRSELQSLVKTLQDIQDFHQKDVSGSNAYFIRGAAGAGKSYLLYTLLHYAKITNKWIILYIPELSKAIPNDPRILKDDHLRLKFEESFADKIIKDFIRINSKDLLDKLTVNIRDTNKDNIVKIKTNSLWDYLNNSNNIDPITKLIEIMDIFRNNKGKYPFLFLLDQWNAVLEIKDRTIGFPFNNFNNLKLTWGITIAAVSSSFQPLGNNMFRDANIADKCLYIPIYTNEEAEMIIENNKRMNLLSSEVTQEKIKDITGNIPRIIYMIQFVWLNSGKRKRLTEVLDEVKKDVLIYYLERVTKHIDKAVKNRLDRANTETIILTGIYVYLNRNIINLHQDWQQSGLFDNSGKVLSPIIKDAFYRIVTNYRTDIFKVLCNGNRTIKGFAFETIFASRFEETSGYCMKLDCTTLNGDDKTLSSHEIQVDKVIRPAKSSDLNRFTENTMIICWDNHPVIDFVIYTNKRIYFIQISLQSYFDYYDKAEDLGMLAVLKRKNSSKQSIQQSKIPQNDKFMIKHKGKERSSSTETIQHYYLSRSPYSNQRDYADKLLNNDILSKKGIYFLYITTDQTNHHNNNSRKRELSAILRLNGNELNRCIGDDLIDLLKR